LENKNIRANKQLEKRTGHTCWNRYRFW